MLPQSMNDEKILTNQVRMCQQSHSEHAGCPFGNAVFYGCNQYDSIKISSRTHLTCGGQKVQHISVILGTMAFFGQRYNNPKDKLMMLLIPLVEMVGVHQVLTLERLIGSVQVRSKKGAWGTMIRKGLTVQQ
jgi:hypothetical protein